MTDFVQMSRENVPKYIVKVIKSDLEELYLQLWEYFSAVTDDSDMWITNPLADGLSTNLSHTLQEEDSLAELSADTSFKL